MIDNLFDEWGDGVMYVIQYDDVIDVIADDVAAFQMYKMQSYAGKSGMLIGNVPDNVTDDMADDMEGLIDFKLRCYAQILGLSDNMHDDIKTAILDKVPGAMRRKLLHESQINAEANALQADVSTSQDVANKYALNSDMLNVPAVDGILNLGQSLSNVNITFSGRVISIGVDSLDSAYKKLKVFGAKMLHQNNRRYFTMSYAGDFKFMCDANGILNYILVKGLKALKSCRIDGYKYKDTLDDFMTRHGKPGNSYEDKDSGNLCYKYYYDDTRRRFMIISASDDYTIDEITIYFND